ncbi:MAG TPA: hypothetical protein PKE69_15855 [Pyrinomonadaceae bacterium]|nr:hypothetical protein [Pyrinomonadaceae bacterium]
MKTLKKIIVLFSICWFGIVANGQTASNEEVGPINESKGEFCESNNSLIDVLAMEIVNNPMATVFVISRGGIGEKLSIVNRRLKYTQMVLLKIKKFNERRVVFASGEKVKGEGNVEFYIGSELFLTISMKKNKPICFLTPDYCGRNNELCK